MKIKTTVKEIVQETPRVRLVRLEGSDIAKLSFRPGQWVGVSCDDFVGENGKPIRRAFSIASEPGQILELCVARGKEFSAYLQDLSVGATVNIDGPFGNFWLRPAKTYLFIAGGTGIAPLRPMLQHALREGAEVALLYSIKTPSDFIYKKELEELRSNPKFKRIVTLTADHKFASWDGETGRVQGHLAKVWKTGMDTYICGPPAMVDDVATHLIALGQPKERIFVDKWE